MSFVFCPAFGISSRSIRRQALPIPEGFSVKVADAVDAAYIGYCEILKIAITKNTINNVILFFISNSPSLIDKFICILKIESKKCSISNKIVKIYNIRKLSNEGKFIES